MKNLKIAIVGNSVGLRVRPPGVFPFNKNYGALIEDILQKEYEQQVITVHNLSMGRATIWDVLKKRGEILNQFPEYYVINLGVTDASTREIPLWYSNVINSDKESLVKKVLNGFYLKIVKRFRPVLVRLRGKRSWTSRHNFEKYMDGFIGFLQKETNARIILLSINNTSDRVEAELPGSGEQYLAFNKIIKRISQKYNTQYLDTTELLQEEHFPDGIHYSHEGHELIANKVSSLIIDYENASKDNNDR